MNKSAKKTIIALSLASLFLAVLFVPQEVHAFLGLGSIGDLVTKLFAHICYYFLKIASFFVYLAGLFFDEMVEFALRTSRELFINNDSVVLVGWRACRDIANMFFIFVIVFIGIATILRIPSYGYKKMLLGIVLAALLINFSLPITRTIIDFSNVMALEFLCKATPDDSCNASQLSASFSNGLAYQTLFSGSDGNVDPSTLSFEKIIMIGVMGTIIILVAAFVIFAGAILLLIRTIVLMILTVLSPFGFLFSALPGKAGSYGSMWWDHLFKQAFFAPVYFFFIYLVIYMINGNYISNLLGTQNASFANLLTADSSGAAGSNVQLLMQYFIILAFLILSLYSAQQLGAYGATGMISLGKSARKRATGYVGKGAKRFALWTGAGASKRISKGEGKIAGTLRKIPGVTRVGARLETARGAALEKKLVEEEKKMVGASDATLKRVVGMKFVSDEKQAAAGNLLAKRNQLSSGLTEKEEDKTGREQWQKNMENVGATLKRAGRSSREIDDRKYQWAANETEQQEALATATPAIIKTILADEDLRKTYIKEGNYETMYKSFNAEKFRAMYEAGTTESEAFMHSLTKLGKSTEELAKSFEARENRSGAAWARGTGQTIAKGYVGEEKKTMV